MDLRALGVGEIQLMLLRLALNLVGGIVATALGLVLLMVYHPVQFRDLLEILLHFLVQLPFRTLFRMLLYHLLHSTVS